MICDNIRISEDGKHLLFAGQDVVEQKNTEHRSI